MFSAPTTSAVPVLDETLAPITIGRREATPQEMRAINALNAVLDDQPAPPRTLFDYSGIAIETRRVRPSAIRARAKHITAPTPPLAATPIAVAPAIMVEPQVSSDDAYSDDYRPAFVAPEFERIAAPSAPATDATDILIEQAAPATTTRDEISAITFEVQERVAHSGDTLEKVAADVVTADPMPFGMATLRLFCC